MKTTKKIVAIFLAVLMAMSMFSVSLTAFAATKKVTKITISKTKATIYTTQTLTLTAKVTPTNATNKKVTWSTSNSKVATVSSKGVVTAKAAGTATITVKAADGSGKKATCKVTVKKLVKITSMKMNYSSKTIYTGNTLTLKVTAKPSNASILTYTWKTSNSKVATVSSKGVVTAKKAGTATITAYATDGSGKKVSCKITVKNFVKITSMTMNYTSKTINTGSSLKLKVTAKPSNATTQTYTWKTSNSKIATVSSTGTVKALKAGTVTIAAYATDGSGKKATCKITVKDVPVSSIKLSKTKATLYPGASLTLKATVSPTNATVPTVKWTTSDSTAATVSSTGVVKAVKAGKTATITATATDGSGKKATCKITVGTYAKEITVTCDEANTSSWYLGKTAKLTATVSPENTTNKNVTWSSDNPNYISVDADGNVKVIKLKKSLLGKVLETTATITATAADGSGVKGTYKVSAVEYIALSSIAFPDTVKDVMYVGQSSNLGVTIEPINASERGISYTSSDPSIITVDGSGNVKALKAGTATITAASVYDASKTVSKTITVKDVTISAGITNKKVFYAVGDTARLFCYTTPSEALDPTYGGLGSKFESEDESVAVIEPVKDAYGNLQPNSALITFKGVGKTRVRALTTNGEAASEWIEVEVRSLKIEESGKERTFFENVKKGDSFVLDAYLFNGSRVTQTDGYSDIDIFLGAYGDYFTVIPDETTGTYTVIIEEDLPADGAYITFKSLYSDISAKVAFISGTYQLPSGSKTELLGAFKAYSQSAKTLSSSDCLKTIKYNDLAVDESKSKTEMTVNGISLDTFIKSVGGLLGDEDMDDLTSEMSPEAMIKELFTDDAVDKTTVGKASYPAEITVDEVDVKSIEVIDDGNITYKMKLTLNDQTSDAALADVNTSAYGKTMKVIDKAFMDNYAEQLKLAGSDELGTDASTTLNYGTITQRYSDGYVIYTIDKLTNKVIDSEYHYKSNISVSNAVFNMTANLADTLFGSLTLGVKLTAYFTMNVETTTNYTSMTY
ncbi:MAG: Ig-like domain-containing protein [Acutalibacteraceae bacterium]